MAIPTVEERLAHMRRSLAIIAGYWKGKAETEFLDPCNEPLRSATERHLLVVAEASKHIPDVDKAAHPQIPWRDVVALGNILRHAYDIVDEHRIWNVVQDDLPALATAIEEIRQKY